MSSLFTALARGAARHPERPALVTQDAALSYAALEARVRGLAERLLAAGGAPGDRVGLCLENAPAWAEAALAVSAVGGVLVPLHPAWTPRQQERALEHAEARALLGAEQGPGELVFIDLSENTPPLTGRALPPVSGEDLGALFYTSGSTGLPKGVMHSHANLTRCAAAIARTLGIGPQDRLLAHLPLAFHYGFSQLSQALSVGASLAFGRARLPAELGAELEALEVSALAAVPWGWASLVDVLEAHPARLRVATNAGGALRPETLTRLRAALPETQLFLMYGFTEALRSTTLPPALLAEKPGAMGLPMPGVRLAVVDEAGQPLPPGELGQLIHAGAFVGLGYWRDPQASAARFGPHPATGPAQAARSGDLVRVDEDGVFWFHARADGVLKIAGHRVGPGEVEERVLASGLVREAAALSVDDPRRGPVLGLVVCPPVGEALDAAALRRWCRAELPGWMQPKRLRALPALPRTATGKPDVAALRAALLEPAG
ncbi:MAG: AMP-binding protein [Alphaproteobacteria bacterium]|nr:AMP-binding protein [Alphaproteobacteria bacterium]